MNCAQVVSMFALWRGRYIALTIHFTICLQAIEIECLYSGIFYN